MDRAADLGAEDVVHQAVLRDPAETGERGATTVARKWSPPPVVSSTSARLPGARLDAGFELFGGWHTGVERSEATTLGSGARSGTGPGVAILREAMSTRSPTTPRASLSPTRARTRSASSSPRRTPTSRSRACASASRAAAAPASSTSWPSTSSATTTRSSRIAGCASSSTQTLPYVDGSEIDFVEALHGRRLQGREPERRRGLRLRLLVPGRGRGRSLRRLGTGRRLAWLAFRPR